MGRPPLSTQVCLMRAPEVLTAPPMILLVEESQSLRPLVSRALLDAGYQVFAAPDPTEASAVLERFHLQPALAIVDLHASLQSGTEVAEAVARGRAELPIIFVARYLEDPDALLPGGAVQSHLRRVKNCCACSRTAKANVHTQSSCMAAGRRSARRWPCNRIGMPRAREPRDRRGR